MSTISSAASSAHLSPKQNLLASIASKVSAGSISSTDQTALDSAVDSIDSSIQSGGSSSSTKLSPSDMKTRVDDLISQQVSAGTLTSAQATTLQQIFAQGPGGQNGSASSDGNGVSGVGGPPPGPPPGQPPSNDGTGMSSAASTSSSSTSSSSDSTSTTAESASDILASFMKQLQASQSQSSGYGATGSTGSGRLVSALLLNFEA